MAGVLYGFLLMIATFFRVVLPILAIWLLMVMAAMALGYSSGDAVGFSSALMMPFVLFTFVVSAPILFGSYFEIFKSVGPFQQRLNNFSPNEASKIVARNKLKSRNLCPPKFRWITGLE
ncbi:hypothetical protein [Tateyamaria sp. ANG-S1]|uniref:hypothetical protein n=1 Tax=Tateyamaria sp. ANG-S1 TaxID=1577905 RepID=UPI00187BF92F|nr:hypothetical protein [Tateyamaria sp. ANG-S1]